MNLLTVVDNTLSHARLYLEYLETARYCQPLDVFSGSSIGQHTRHIIEFLECLIRQSESGVINYDQRLRSRNCEENPEVALLAIDEIVEQLKHHNLSEKLTLAFTYDCLEDRYQTVETTFERELVYNIEHAIHHLAIIKIGLKLLAPEIEVPTDFGVAPSTIKYQGRHNA